MSMLCNRCELLFGACRPLLGQVCDLAAEDAAQRPKVPASPEHAAALIYTNRHCRLQLVPVLAFDFYPKEHSWTSMAS